MKLRRALIWGLPVVAVSLVAALLSIGQPVRSGPQQRRQSPLEITPVDPRAYGKFYSTALTASAASKRAFPDCPGANAYYVEPDGALVEYFQGGDDLKLWVTAPGNPPAGPFQTTAAITSPQTFSVRGQQAWGFESKPGGETVAVANGTQGTDVRSVVTWNESGDAIHLTSFANLSLNQLIQLANSCTMASTSPAGTASAGG